MQLVAVVCNYIVSGRQYLFASLQRPGDLIVSMKELNRIEI